MTEPPATPPPPLSSPPIKVENHDEITSSRDSGPCPASHIPSGPVTPVQYASPMRQHKRAPSVHREIKETLDARVEYGNDDEDGPTQHHINQYTIKEEIGRGSYGSVHLAIDQYGTEYAVKEFSKVRLRKRAQSHILRQGPRGVPRNILPRAGLGGPGQAPNPRLGGARAGEAEDALYLIREEVAIMKKLNHPNLVQLIEVLDDPEEDSLYMVMEMCKKGVIMKVGLEQVADPYGPEACRYWFRDLMLGIEYLHEQGVIHRDIKPDNLLVSEDDILKVVDFGVSEMFEKADDMQIAKSAGSPAFLPPELCGKHGNVSGKAADIWGMGVTLYCLRYGKIPFNREGMLEIFEAIKNDEPHYPEDEDPDFVDVMKRLLEKAPDKRIKMSELREHTWVTRAGTDGLLSKEENCAHMVEPPNELELNRAFTRKMNHLLCIMKAIHRFKTLLAARRRRLGADATGSASNPPGIPDDDFDPARAKARAAEIDVVALISRRRKLVNLGENESGGDKGHAHDISDPEPLFLGIGTGSRDDFAMDEASPDVVADSPTAVDFNIYDRAYEEAVEERLRANSSHKPTLYLTRFVKEKEHFKKLENLVDDASAAAPRILDRVRSSGQSLQHNMLDRSSASLTQLAGKLGISDSKDDVAKPSS